MNNTSNQDILLGILLGNDNSIDKQTKEEFINSNLSHILAVSGMHVSYVIIIINFAFSKLNVGRRKIKIVTIVFLVFFIFLVGGTPSVKRACIMAILGIIAVLINRKSDAINNMAISLLISLIQNPFCILNTGLILSYIATLGIILLLPKNKKSNKLKQVIMVSISAWIAILPINMILFQTVSFTFIFSNLCISFIIGIIILLGFIISIPFPMPIIAEILDILLLILKAITKIFSSIPLSNISVCSPNIIIVLIYYIVIGFFIYIKNLKR